MDLRPFSRRTSEMKSCALIWASLVALLPAAAVPAAAQSKAEGAGCAIYQTTARAVSAGAVPVIRAELLTDIDLALQCLVPLLDELDKRPGRPAFRPAERAQYLSVTGALRSMISSALASDDAAAELHKAALERFKAGGSVGEPPVLPSSRLRAFIDAFRERDNTRVASVLVHALRDEERTLRANALLILSNVVDNRTVCVALDHLYDPELLTPVHGRTARANLLAVVQIVAPWAYRDTYLNIEKVVDYTEPRVESGDPGLAYTHKVLQIIRERLGRQRPDSNKAVCLPKNQRDCYSYVAEKASKEQLRYPGPRCPPPD
jgi:hypothetical protein